MDPKVIEMNNLRVLNDYLNQTIDVLVRGQRLGNGHAVGYSPFGPSPAGTDVVYGPSPYPFQSSPFPGAPFPSSPFAAQSPFTGLPLVGSPYGTVDPYLAQRTMGGPFGPWQHPWGQTPWTQGQVPWTQGQVPWTQGQTPWTPIAEATRQAHVAHALAARQSVLEAMCRCAGIPV